LEPGGESKKAADPPPAHAAAAAAVVDAKTLKPPDRTTRRRKSGVLGPNVTGGNRGDLPDAPDGGVPRRRRHSPGPDVSTRALQLRPLASEVRGNPRQVGAQRGSRKPNDLETASTTPTLAGRQEKSSTDGCLSEPEDGSGYWDWLGRKHGSRSCHNNAEAGSEQTESALGSVMLLRWAMECFLGNEDDGIAGELSIVGQKPAALTENGQEERVPAAGSSAAVNQGRAMNATISGPVHLMHSERNPRESDLFLFSDPSESAGENNTSSPRQSESTSPFAATSPTPLTLSQSRSLERLTDRRSISRGLKRATGEDSGGKRRSDQGSDHDRSVSDTGVISSNRAEEPAMNAAGGEDGSGERKSWVASRTIASTRQSADGTTGPR